MANITYYDWSPDNQWLNISNFSKKGLKMNCLKFQNVTYAIIYMCVINKHTLMDRD